MIKKNNLILELIIYFILSFFIFGFWIFFQPIEEIVPAIEEIVPAIEEIVPATEEIVPETSIEIETTPIETPKPNNLFYLKYIMITVLIIGVAIYLKDFSKNNPEETVPVEIADNLQEASEFTRVVQDQNTIGVIQEMQREVIGSQGLPRVFRVLDGREAVQEQAVEAVQEQAVEAVQEQAVQLAIKLNEISMNSDRIESKLDVLRNSQNLNNSVNKANLAEYNETIEEALEHIYGLLNGQAEHIIKILKIVSKTQ